MFLFLIKKLKIYISNLLKPTLSVNYIFFSFFVLAITCFSALKTNLLFTLYALIQAILLTIILISLHHLIRSKFLKNIFASFFFIMLFAYFANFILIGLMNNSLLFAFNVFLSGGLKNLFITIKALNLNVTISLCILAAILLVPIIGIITYNITHKISLKKPFIIKQKYFFNAFVFLLLTLFSLEIFCKIKNIDYIYNNQKKLPLGFCFFSKDQKKIILPHRIKPLKDSTKLLEKIETKNLKAKKLPNIFIFVTEALRNDFITPEIASNIYSFSKENISFKNSYSAANATHISWYSIFHSNQPFYWSEACKNKKFGSLPLKVLKKIGYKVNLFTSAELKYFHLDELIFGKNLNLVDNLNDFSAYSLDPAIRDAKCIKSLLNNLDTSKSPNIFIIFLDSTHSEYSWPKAFKPKFLPIQEKINYITLSQSKKNLNLIKNRYKNAINYIDHLFSKFLTSLKSKNLYENSIIAFTADHGEEFFEKGALFHTSHLNEYQVNVPIILKLLKNNQNHSDTISHIDIFPTILSEILNQNLDDFFDGKSIFERKDATTISVNQKGNLTPNELFITNDNMKLHGKLLMKENAVFLVEDFENVQEENLEKEANKFLQSLLE